MASSSVDQYVPVSTPSHPTFPRLGVSSYRSSRTGSSSVASSSTSFTTVSSLDDSSWDNYHWQLQRLQEARSSGRTVPEVNLLPSPDMLPSSAYCRSLELPSTGSSASGVPNQDTAPSSAQTSPRPIRLRTVPFWGYWSRGRGPASRDSYSTSTSSSILDALNDCVLVAAAEESSSSSEDIMPVAEDIRPPFASTDSSLPRGAQCSNLKVHEWLVQCRSAQQPDCAEEEQRQARRRQRRRAAASTRPQLPLLRRTTSVESLPYTKNAASQASPARPRAFLVPCAAQQTTTTTAQEQVVAPRRRASRRSSALAKLRRFKKQLREKITGSGNKELWTLV